MIQKIIWWLGLSIASSICYRIGGWKKGNKLIRRLGCSLLALGLFLGLQGFNLRYWWIYCLFLILNYAALSTYHDYVGFDCWPLTGWFYGLAAIPLLWCGVAFWAIIGRAIFLALTIWWLRERTGKDWLEEMGSGFLYCGSIPILLL